MVIAVDWVSLPSDSEGKRKNGIQLWVFWPTCLKKSEKDQSAKEMIVFSPGIPLIFNKQHWFSDFPALLNCFLNDNVAIFCSPPRQTSQTYLRSKIKKKERKSQFGVLGITATWHFLAASLVAVSQAGYINVIKVAEFFILFFCNPWFRVGIQMFELL